MLCLNKLMEKIMGRKKPTPPPSVTSGAVLFSDNFNTGFLGTNWIVSNWNAPGGGVFRPDMIDMSQGLLGLKINQTQNPDGTISSTGAEIQLNKLFGYGVYEWIFRASSSAQTPSAMGNSFSGSVSGCFNYLKTSETELDFEIEGCKPNIIQCTTWKGETNPNEHTGFDNLIPLDAEFHSFKYIWLMGKVEYYFDEKLIATHTKNVPSSPAYPMINHWGTNSVNWGGLATPGVDRWMWVNSFTIKSL